MVTRLGVSLVLFVLAQLISATPAQSSSGNGILDAFRGSIDILYPDYEAYRDTLESKDPGDWTRDEVKQYLETSLILIYHVMNIYLVENSGYPPDPNQLQTTSELPEWPLNPFTGQPVSFAGVADEFSPGIIVFQSKSGRYHNFEMSILGPSIDWMDNDEGVIASSNKGWVKRPTGYVMSIGLTSHER